MIAGKIPVARLDESAPEAEAHIPFGMGPHLEMSRVSLIWIHVAPNRGTSLDKAKVKHMEENWP